MSFDLIIDWLQATLRWSAPLIIVSVGELFSERSGIINLGIEGIMLSVAADCGLSPIDRTLRPQFVRYSTIAARKGRIRAIQVLTGC